jgi:nicotinate-nucleotide adenylyltransferase
VKLGIFGGTFDPIHLGHLVLAEEALEQLRLERIIWVLTPDPPHKQGISVSSWELRFRLLSFALSDNQRFEISRVDLDRSPPYYAVETMHLLRETHQNDSLIYLMGGDSLQELSTWHNPEMFIEACDGFGIMQRPGSGLDYGNVIQIFPELKGKIHSINAPLLDISSSDIRQRISSGRHFRYFLPTKVYDYVRAHNLYNSNVT